MSRRRAKPGQTLSLGPPAGQLWTWMTNIMLGSITFRALGIGARRILDFLMYEHASHAGRENGRLGATYAQLEAWGCSTADIRKDLEALVAVGLIRVTSHGNWRNQEFNRYALTWLPTFDGKPATHEWLRVIEDLNKEGIGNVRAVRRWLKAVLADERRGKKGRAGQVVQMRGASPRKREASGSE